MFKKREIDPKTIKKKDELLNRVKPILAKQLEIDENEITPASRIAEDLRADSLDAIEIIMALEEEFRIEIPDEDSENIKTVDDIVAYLYRKVKL